MRVEAPSSQDPSKLWLSFPLFPFGQLRPSLHDARDRKICGVDNSASEEGSACILFLNLQYTFTQVVSFGPDQVPVKAGGVASLRLYMEDEAQRSPSAKCPF